MSNKLALAKENFIQEINNEIYYYTYSKKEDYYSLLFNMIYVKLKKIQIRVRDIQHENYNETTYKLLKEIFLFNIFLIYHNMKQFDFSKQLRQLYDVICK